MYRLSNYADLKEGTMIAKTGFIKAIGLLNSKYIRVSYNIKSLIYEYVTGKKEVPVHE